MSSRFNKALKVSLVLHGVVIVLLLVLPLMSQCARKKPRENVMFVEMVSPSPPAPPAPTPPAPRPPDPKPPPPKPPEPQPEPKPEPVKQEVKKQEIKVNTNRIVRRDIPPPAPPTPPKPRLTEEELRKQLLSSLPTSPNATASMASPSELSSYYGTIQRILYEAWAQPPGVAGLQARVSIRIARNGSIMQRNLMSGSGSPAMDESVMKTLRSVSTFPRLPDSFKDAFLDVTITFESTGLSL